MDVDDDFDASLLRNFSCMGTTDKEVLINQLQTLIGINLSQQAACFYLDMTNWNVQAAVCAYFDMESGGRLPRMNLLRDDTVGEGESVQPSTRFQKTWCIRNEGIESWPSHCRLVFTSGDRLEAPFYIEVMPLAPGETRKISLEMVSPAEPGIYSSKWRMSTQEGAFFGDAIWVIVRVEPNGTLALLQQMESFGNLGSQPRPEPPRVANPFSLNAESIASGPVLQYDHTNNNGDSEMS